MKGNEKAEKVGSLENIRLSSSGGSYNHFLLSNGDLQDNWRGNLYQEIKGQRVIDLK